MRQFSRGIGLCSFKIKPKVALVSIYPHIGLVGTIQKDYPRISAIYRSAPWLVYPQQLENEGSPTVIEISRFRNSCTAVHKLRAPQTCQLTLQRKFTIFFLKPNTDCLNDSTKLSISTKMLESILTEKYTMPSILTSNADIASVSF
jgi:hypothetical protein